MIHLFMKPSAFDLAYRRMVDGDGVLRGTEAVLATIYCINSYVGYMMLFNDPPSQISTDFFNAPSFTVTALPDNDNGKSSKCIKLPPVEKKNQSASTSITSLFSLFCAGLNDRLESQCLGFFAFTHKHEQERFTFLCQ